MGIAGAHPWADLGVVAVPSWATNSRGYCCTSAPAHSALALCTKQPALFHVLDLFTQAFDLGFERDHQVRQARILALGPYRIGFAAHLLQQKIELSAARARRL